MGFFDKWRVRKDEEERKAQEWNKTLREMEAERKVKDMEDGSSHGKRNTSHAASTVTFTDDWLNRLKEQVDREQGILPSEEETHISSSQTEENVQKQEAVVEENQTEQKEYADFSRTASDDEFHTLFSASVGKIFANQQAFSKKVVGGKDWFIDFTQGIISFEENEFPVQLLGSQSEELNTWLWIWANESVLPDQVKEDALICKAYGEEHGLSQLTTASLPLTEHLNSHMITIVSAAVHPENVCYYRAPYEGGVAFVLVKDLPSDIFEPVDALTFANLCTQIITAYAVDHKKMVEGFLRDNGCQMEWKDNQRILADFGNYGNLLIEFDIYGRIKSMNTEA